MAETEPKRSPTQEAKRREELIDGIEHTTAPFESGETPIRVIGHSGVMGKVGTTGTIGEQGVWRWFETSDGVKRFRVKNLGK